MLRKAKERARRRNPKFTAKAEAYEGDRAHERSGITLFRAVAEVMGSQYPQPLSRKPNGFPTREAAKKWAEEQKTEMLREYWERADEYDLKGAILALINKNPRARAAWERIVSDNRNLGWRDAVRTLGDDVERGRKVMAGARAAHKQTHGSQKEKAECWKAYRDSFDDLHKRNPYRPKEWCYTRLAKQFNVCIKTIKRHVSQK